MVSCVGFETVYRQKREYQGYWIDEAIHESVWATQHGVIHFKIIQNVKNGKVRVFVDQDTSRPEDFLRQSHSQRVETLKRHKEFYLTNKRAKANNATFLQSSYTNSNDVAQYILGEAVMSDEKAKRAWNYVCGIDENVPSYNDYFDQAEKIVQEERRGYIQQKAVAMATVDDQWGIF